MKDQDFGNAVDILREKGQYPSKSEVENDIEIIYIYIFWTKIKISILIETCIIITLQEMMDIVLHTTLNFACA